MEPRFNPTPDQTFELEGSGRYNFVRTVADVEKLVAEGRYAEACEVKMLCSQGKSLCVILKSDDPAWRNLPRPAKTVTEGEFSCAVFYDCTIHQDTAGAK